MSIGSAFHNANSGLAASTRLAETISNNVANAMTPGYARRSAELSSVGLGGYGAGVRVASITRADNPIITAERRLMAASSGAATALSTAGNRLAGALGAVGSATSLPARATSLETALMAAAASPESSIWLQGAVDAAKALATSLNKAATEIAQVRTDAESEIAAQVAGLNKALSDVETLNAKIRTGAQQGVDVSALEDERAKAIDRVAEFLPVKTVKRDGGEIAVFTANGAALVDGKAWPIRFERHAAAITPEMGAVPVTLTQELAGASIPLSVGTGTGLMDGGTLGALFEVRDVVALEAQGKLDAYAADLIARFETVGGAGQGLFVSSDADLGRGVAARLQVHAAVDPAQGGEAVNLRAGIALPRTDGTGYGGHLQALVDAATAARTIPGFPGASAGAAGLAGELTAFYGAEAARADETRAYMSAQHTLMAEQEAGALGVDTDTELQLLMVVEQAYAANARVIAVLDSLLKQLLEI